MTPCKDCLNRRIGCHASCKMYLEWSKANRKHKDAERLLSSLRNISVNSIERHDKWIKNHKS